MTEKKTQIITINEVAAYQIKGFDPCYYLSSMGEVYSTKRGGPDLLSGVIGKNGYKAFTLRKNGKDVRVTLHRLVAEKFCVRPTHCDVVNHKDGNKLNNLPENLEWVTARDNVRHAIRTGLMRKSPMGHIAKMVFISHSRRAKFTLGEADEIRTQYHGMEIPEYAAIAKLRGCGTETIRRIVLGKQKIFKEVAA